MNHIPTALDFDEIGEAERWQRKFNNQLRWQREFNNQLREYVEWTLVQDEREAFNERNEDLRKSI